MALDDVGANPVKLAEAVHAQLGETTGPVDVHAIAGVLDIDEIREAPLKNFEGALVTQPERSHGAILVNANSSLQRRRYTIGHELGHFLNPWHRPTSPNGLWCSREDMTLRESKDQNRHWRQEAEANIFAIELLVPRRRVRRYVAGAPDLERVLEMATVFDISREASARRYVSLHADNLAAVFSKEGRIRYIDRPNSFPWLSLRKDDLLPELPKPGGADLLSPIEEADPSDWLDRPRDVNLTVQTLHQQNGFAITLLGAEALDEDCDDGIDDTVERFARQNK
jgi:Zn-dependent peptidase ImmA (M78 family)